MKSILEASVYTSIIVRIDQLQPDSKGNWGKMTPNEMICHLSDCLRDILGIRPMEAMLPPEYQQQLKAVVFGEKEWDHNLPTLPVYSQDNGGAGTPPLNFTDDRNTLLMLLDQFYNTTADFQFHPHAGLDILSRDEFGVYIGKHTDYHLQQFGV